MRISSPHHFSECALPYMEGVPWDGVTYSSVQVIDDGIGFPSGGAGVWIPAYGLGTLFPIGFTLPQLYAFLRGQIKLDSSLSYTYAPLDRSVSHVATGKITVPQSNGLLILSNASVSFENIADNDHAVPRKESAILDITGVGTITTTPRLEIRHGGVASAPSLSFSAEGNDENYLLTGPVGVSQITASDGEADEEDPYTEVSCSVIYEIFRAHDVFDPELSEFGAFSYSFRVLKGQDGLWYPAMFMRFFAEITTGSGGPGGYNDVVISSIKPHPSVSQSHSVSLPFEKSLPLYYTFIDNDASATLTAAAVFDAWFPFDEDGGTNPLFDEETGAWLG